MWLILCSSSDPSGLWAYEGLRRLGVAPLELILAESLAYGSLWEHRLDSGGTHLKIVLPDRRTLCSSRIRGAVNRLLAPAPGITERAAVSDKEYAQAELQAFYLSWIKGLPGVVINRPTPIGLCGSWYHPSEWAYRASHSGLPIAPYRHSAHDAPEKCYRPLVPQGATMLNVIVFRGEVFGAQLPEPTLSACAKLADASETEMLGMGLYADENGEWTFANATPCPDLSVGGVPLLQRLAKALTQGEPA
ncbi:MAG TPA: hypothetical protein VNU74_02520 [Terriglobales bacterium]|jgi:hypothetical protein|nr:hypothetical protein [Terriglobales bacterium]